LWDESHLLVLKLPTPITASNFAVKSDMQFDQRGLASYLLDKQLNYATAICKFVIVGSVIVVSKTLVGQLTDIVNSTRAGIIALNFILSLLP
jgi:hypothetical protein